MLEVFYEVAEASGTARRRTAAVAQ